MMVWPMVVAAVVSAVCAVVGTMLVVRRMSLLGDAIGHGVLPGIVVAVLAGGRPGGMLSTFGAVAAAILTVWAADAVRRRARLSEDAAAGVVFTTFFAAGVVLISLYASRVDLDPGCVLHGILELAAADTVSILGIMVPRPLVNGLVALAVVASFLAATWPAQVFAAFDTDAARVVGAPVGFATMGLLAMTAVATVASFEAVGAVLVVAMLVVPAATAELLFRSLGRVMAAAVVIAVAAAVAGYLAAWRWNTSAAGMIAVVLGLGYLAAVLAAPGEGIIPRLVGKAWLAWRVACEDVLAQAWRREEAGGAVPTVPNGLLASFAASWLRLRGKIDGPRDRPVLTDAGRGEAETIVRSHRLWEAWLGRNVELPLDHLHPPAEWVEHYLGADARKRIEEEVGAASSDPHGREIPTEPG
jgi:ABC-type Mn2+/Zn2+ transport system permease subunit